MNVEALNVTFTQYIHRQQLGHEFVCKWPFGQRDWPFVGWPFGQRDCPFFGWCFLYSWAAGLREVVSFQGDAGTVTTISANYDLLTMPPNAAEIPYDLAFMLQLAIKYITALLLILVALVVVYTITS
ncbi:Aste57867_23068 [Aphanomyces stellatus]|uniref:Aste57867_23068 protein n=1 Tax=Aphanomyces stellatus TaxID=120398 RepID=A0A485LM77_9STRA|nr:hypothetical protein As57867_022997 [Aphanomyces stellatus]VFT99716.1 Aste57867_23068 [Aphanomyces stellatus]